MPDTMSPEIRYQRALRRLETFSERAERIARVVTEAESAWAPDDGIATMRDHVERLVTSVRGLNRRLDPERDARAPAVNEITAINPLRPATLLGS